MARKDVQKLIDKDPQNAAFYAKVMKDLHRKFNPHPAQIEIGKAILSGQYKEVFVAAGRNCGKSSIAIYLLWRWALTHPNTNNYYFAPYNKQARSIVWENRAMQGFMPNEYTSKTPGISMKISLMNGSFIKVDGSDNTEAYRGVKPKGLTIFDEFKDFREEFYTAYDPNRAAFDSPILIIGTPPDRECQFTQLMDEFQRDPKKAFFRFPTSANPHIKKQWLDDKKNELYAKGEGDVWQREYEAIYTKGGAAKIFPMLSKERHVRPHDWVLSQIKRDRKKLSWYAVADPAAASVFGVLFVAINPFNRMVYVLDEIYETDQAAMSVGAIGPRIHAKREELYDDHFNWRLVYDEAETWWRSEMLDRYGEGWEPTQKAANDKESGLSLIKDLLLTDKLIMSERCEKLFWEMDNYFKDRNGNIPKKNDHLTDCVRYLTHADNYTTQGEIEEIILPEDMPRPEKLPDVWNTDTNW
jgi:hypothetical protein